MNLKEHQFKAAEISIRIGKELGLSNQDLTNLYIAAALHDIGKSEIPNSIVYKPGKLTFEETKIMRTHSIKSYEILTRRGFDSLVAISAKYHHERFDGTGYPEGLNDRQIPLFSKIIAVSDSYDAMTSPRIYRKHILSKELALKEIEINSGKQFDPMVVESFLNIS